MKKLTQKEFKVLFSNLCCSRCKNEFSMDAITQIEKEGDIIICELICTKCQKNFGQIVLNYNKKAKSHLPLEVIEGAEPISINEVIDAHNFIKENL